MPDGRILIFGGLDRRKRFNDVWILDGKNRVWVKPVIQGEGPCPRAHHSATLVGNSIWIYGGYRYAALKHGLNIAGTKSLLIGYALYA
jgi:dynein heavy chain